MYSENILEIYNFHKMRPYQLFNSLEHACGFESTRERFAR